MLKVIICTIALACAASGYAKDTQWEPLNPGISYKRVSIPSASTHGRIHAFKVSLEDYRLNIALAEDYDKLALSAAKFAHRAKVPLTINGGFFSPDFKPLGLRVQNGTTRSYLKKTSWWGVFYIKNKQPHIVSQRYYPKNMRMEFAIQAGPRLLVNGHIPKLKGGYAERSALCITHKGEVVITITEHAPLTTRQFAQILKKPASKGGIDCYQALNLDGGNSSQLYARINDFSLKVTSFHDVTDAVIVQPRKRRH